MKASNLDPVHILIVDDDPAAVGLTKAALATMGREKSLHVVRDGAQALDFVFRRGAYPDAPRPQLIVLDWNLPQRHGREVLTEIKESTKTRDIPVVVLSTSSADADVSDAYSRYANCYVAKAQDFDEFCEALASVEKLWADVVELPTPR